MITVPENVKELGPELVKIWVDDKERIKRETARIARAANRRHGNEYHCPRCDKCHALLVFFDSPKCWQSIQRRMKRKYEQGDADLRHCEDCGKPIYWSGYWSVKWYRCPRCYKSNRPEERRQLARRRYKQLRVAIPQPLCKQCGEKFKAVRKDAKYCSSRCRVAAHRVEHAKKHSTKKRRKTKKSVAQDGS